jgi:hypothetical protein
MATAYVLKRLLEVKVKSVSWTTIGLELLVASIAQAGTAAADGPLDRVSNESFRAMV